MREIIFRGKSIENGEWVTGYYCNCSLPNGNQRETGHYIIEYPNRYHEIYADTVGQYTGLKDKNGKKIFEGNIVKHHDITEVVKFEYCFCIKWENNFGGTSILPLSDMITLEIIGNIYDNKDLLKGERQNEFKEI